MSETGHPLRYVVAAPWVRPVLLAIVPVMLLVAGTVGYVVIEGWGWFDALYMTVITLITIGYAEVHPLHQGGRAFTIVLALGGATTLAAVAAYVLQFLISGELNKTFGRQRMQRALDTVRDHVIICGYGRVGRRVVEDIAASGVPVVVVDQDEGRLRDCPLWVAGDVTKDATLKRAGIARARALVASVPSDADNLYVTMSARLLNANLTIVARAESEGTEEKLLRAGATRVVSPAAIGGQRVVQAVLRPAVLDFIDLATSPTTSSCRWSRPSSRRAARSTASPSARRRCANVATCSSSPSSAATGRCTSTHPSTRAWSTASGSWCSATARASTRWRRSRVAEPGAR
jgi:voltage-gated potassium channel